MKPVEGANERCRDPTRRPGSTATGQAWTSGIGLYSRQQARRERHLRDPAPNETVVDGGRFGTDRVGYRTMRARAMHWPNRVWAIEGCNGIGRHVANRLLRDGEDVVNVPPKLSARARVAETLHHAVDRDDRDGGQLHDRGSRP